MLSMYYILSEKFDFFFSWRGVDIPPEGDMSPKQSSIFF